MDNRQTGVRGLVFGGLMAALAVVCALVPFLSVFMPIPLTMAYMRYGGRIATMAGIVAVLFCALFFGPIQAFLLLVPAGILPGLAFGFGFSRKLRPITISLIAVAVFFASFGLDYVVTRALVLGGQDPIAAMLEAPEVQRLLDTYLGAYEQRLRDLQPTTEAQQQAVERALSQMTEIRENIVEVAWILMPSSLFLAGVVTTWFNYLLCRWILPRFGFEIPAPTPFGDLRLPLWLTWVLVAALFGASFVGDSLLNAPLWARAIINLANPLLYIFGVAGMAVAYGFLRRKGLDKPVAVLLTLAVLLMFGQWGLYFYLMLAMWDTVFDFRGLGHGMFNRPRGST
ncbi:MAG TPA: DUF2232 domain-containing protein [Symbiobacteriaceae bacterium]